jgi:glycosyltransferase involved in cell wall biosynthesis
MTKNKPFLLTVVTITYNSEKTIIKNLKSVSDLKSPLVEHLVIDGASSDRTVEMALDFDSYVDLRVITEPDKGISDAFNKGVRNARGRFVHFLNSDDYYDVEQMLEFLVYLNSVKRVNLIICTPIQKILADGSTVIKLNLPEPKKLKLMMSVYHPGCFISADVFEEIGSHKLERKVAMDYDLILRAYVSGVEFVVSNFFPTVFVVGGLSSIGKKNILTGYYEVCKSQHDLDVLTFKSFLIHFDRSFTLLFPRSFKLYRLVVKFLVLGRLKLKRVLKRVIKIK